jgi:hypothetical protein
MSGVLEGELQSAFFAIAAILIPEAEGMPCASNVDGASEILDRILTLRSDLRDDLVRGLRLAQGKDPAETARQLQIIDPAAYAAIGTIAAAGYYMSPSVRALIGYPGQEKRTFDPDATPDYVANGMLKVVVDRGPIYRPTPR